MLFKWHLNDSTFPCYTIKLVDFKQIFNMKNILLMLTALVIMAGCNDSAWINNIGNEQTILMDTAGNAQAEKNFKTQIKEYVVAFHKGDADIALYYIYPDLFEYLKLQFPDQNFDEQIIKDSVFYEPMKKIKKMAEDKQVELEFEIGDISKKIQYKEYKLYMVVNRINLKMGLDNHSLGEEVIGISDDGGINWKFIANDPETLSGILRLRFPKRVIDELSAK